MIDRFTHVNRLTTLLPPADHPTGSRFGFSKHLMIDLFGCNPLVSDAQAIARYATEVVALLEMKPFGLPQVQHFGHHSPQTSGYTAVMTVLNQLIETSNVSGQFLEVLLDPDTPPGTGMTMGHYVDADRTAHLDLNSCQEFDHEAAITHAVAFFEAQRVVVSVVYR